MPVRKLLPAALLLIAPSAVPVVAEEFPNGGEDSYIPSETTVTYVGKDYWLRTKLTDNWAYALSPTEDGMQLMVGQDPETESVSSDVITFTEKQAFDDWPKNHEAVWAADAYRDWEVAVMRAEGVEAGLYRLEDVETGETDVGGKTLYTLKYRQIVPDPGEKNLVIHAHLYLYFPDDYAKRRRFYWIHYQHLCEEGEQEQLLLAIVNGLLSSLSTSMEVAPRQSSVSWSSLDGTYVAINALGDGRTHYFSNDVDRRCFSYSLDGFWATMNTPGYFVGPNGFDTVAVEFAGAFELTDYPGEDIVERVIEGKRVLLEFEAPGEVRVIDVEDADHVYPGARKVTYEVPFEALGLAGKSVTNFYIAGIATGWAALVHVRRMMNIRDDDLAGEVFRSIRLTDEPECFRVEIDELLR